MSDTKDRDDDLEAHEIGIGLLVAALGVGFVLFNLNMCGKGNVDTVAITPAPAVVTESSNEVDRVVEVEADSNLQRAEASVDADANTMEMAEVEAPVVEVKTPEMNIPKVVENATETVSDATEAVVDTASDVASFIGAGLNAFGQKIGDLFSFSLPDGASIDIPRGGFEEAFATQLADDSQGEIRHIFDRIYFASGSYALDAASNDQVVATAAIIEAYGIDNILLRGHTDSEGDTASNYQLSLDRGNAVRDALIAQGVGAQIEVQGMGESEPVDTNDTEEGRRNNRRMDITVNH